VPIQIIDATFGAVPASCPKPDQGPADAGFKGVLGVGAFIEDCGPACEQDPANGVYFSCAGASCSGVALALASQIQNPVARLPGDGNGLVVELPSIAAGGAPSVSGSLVLGIGTRANNAPLPATTFPLDLAGSFNTTLSGRTTSAFLDTGSNGLFFAAPTGVQLPGCSAPNDQWFCPSSTLSLSAVNTASSGSPATTVAFQIGNFVGLTSSPNAVFAEIGGPAPVADGFDWGLPFYLGRRVYLGIETRGSPLGTGPYVAY
jgi:hypothetical protein